MGASLFAYGVVWIVKFVDLQPRLFSPTVVPGAEATSAAAERVIRMAGVGAPPAVRPPGPLAAGAGRRWPSARAGRPAEPAWEGPARGRTSTAAWRPRRRHLPGWHGAGGQGLHARGRGHGTLRSRAGRRAQRPWPTVEIGTYCGKSATYLGAAARETGTVLFSVDHHRGFRGAPAGMAAPRPRRGRPGHGMIDTLPWARRTIARPVSRAASSWWWGSPSTVARAWRRPCRCCSSTAVTASRWPGRTSRSWSPKVASGGTLAVHDVFADPGDGGQVPYEIYCAGPGLGRNWWRTGRGRLAAACCAAQAPPLPDRGAGSGGPA